MTLLQLLNSRVNLAKAFTDEFHKEVDKCIKDYECKEPASSLKDETVFDRHITKKRYTFPIPYIYSTHESMLSSMFERIPELIISGKGAKDDDKALLLQSIYKYLWDKLDLEEHLNTSAWWFLLIGFVCSYQSYSVVQSGESPAIDSEGNPMMDDEMGEPLMQPQFSYHDPIVEIDDPKKVYFSPDSKFSIDGSQLPYIIREKLMSKEEVEKIFGVEIEPTEEIELANFKSTSTDDKNELKRIKVYYYSGILSGEIESDKKEEYEEGKEYSVVFTKSTVLSEPSAEEKKVSMAKWFGAPNKFFGYGLGKTLRTVQKEMSIRRGQQVRYADIYAYPWLTVNAQTTVDQVSLNDIQKRKPLVWSGQKPEYLVPPEMPKTLIDADNISRSDAQFISGTLDMSKGAQQTNTVKTATGQQIFAQSQEKRVNKARRSISKYFRQVVINLFKLCRDNWTEEKVISITDEEEGITEEITVSGEMLKDIDFDTDIDISLDSLSVNKDTIAERAIALYDKVKDDPLVDRKKIFKKMLKDGFYIKNPDLYLLPEGQEGTQTTGNEPPPPMPGQEGVVPPQEPYQEPPQQTMGQELAPNPNENPYGQ